MSFSRLYRLYISRWYVLIAVHERPHVCKRKREGNAYPGHLLVRVVQCNPCFVHRLPHESACLVWSSSQSSGRVRGRVQCQARELPVNSVRGSLVLRRADGNQKVISGLFAAVSNL